MRADGSGGAVEVAWLQGSEAEKGEVSGGSDGEVEWTQQVLDGPW